MKSNGSVPFQKFITKPQSMYVDELILTPFGPFDKTSCKKLLEMYLGE